MNKPTKPTPPTAPVKPERSRLVNKYHEVHIHGYLQGAIDELAKLGITDLSQIEVGQHYDRSGDREYYTLEWTTPETETQSDEQWAHTMAAYETNMATYRKQWMAYETKRADYEVAIAAYEANEERVAKEQRRQQWQNLSREFGEPKS